MIVWALVKVVTVWVGQGLDISQSMLDVAVGREVEGDVCLADMGQGLPVRGGAFDGAISISAVQVCPLSRACCFEDNTF